MCIYSKHKTLDEFHSGEKKMVSAEGKKSYILDKYMQVCGQWPKFNDLKICLWELFRKQAESLIICKPMFCHPHIQRKRLVRKSNMNQSKNYEEETFSFTTKLLVICFTLFATWGLKGILELSSGSLMYAKGSKNYVPISSK